MVFALETLLCGLATSVPSGIAMLIGSDLCPSLSADIAVVTRSQTAAMHRKAELQQTTSASVADVTPSYSDKESDAVDDSVQSSLASLFDSSNIADTIPFKLVDRTELIMLQQSGPDLSSLFELANRGDDRYCIRSGVLVRSWRDKLAPPESRIHQVIVPTTLRPKLLQIAHNIPAARHLGIAKTQSRLLWHFCLAKYFS